MLHLEHSFVWCWNLTFRAVNKKHLESFETWCWRRMEKTSWTDRVRNVEVFLRVNKQRNILHAIRKRKANWTGHILRRNCLLKHVIEEKIKEEIEVTRRQGRRLKKLLDDHNGRWGYSHLNEEALDRNMWRDRFGRGFGTFVRQTTGWWWWFCNLIQNIFVAACEFVSMTDKYVGHETLTHYDLKFYNWRRWLIRLQILSLYTAVTEATVEPY